MTAISRPDPLHAGADPCPAAAEAALLADAAGMLSWLAARHGHAGRTGRRAEILAWRATALRAAAGTLDRPGDHRLAYSAARIARVAALDAAETGGCTSANRLALARATAELGLTSLALGLCEGGCAGRDLIRDACGHLDAAADALERLGRKGDARRARRSADTARAALHRA